MSDGSGPVNMLRAARIFAVAIAMTLTLGGAMAAYRSFWAWTAIAGLLLLLGTFGLLLHLHRKVGNAARNNTRMLSSLRDEWRRDNSLDLIRDELEEGRFAGAVLDRIAADVADLDRRVAARHESAARSAATLDSFRTSAIKRLDRLGRDHYRLFHEPVTELDALHQLRELVPLSGRRPPVWGWALSPRSLLHLAHHVEQHAPRTIVECGSGLSSLYLGSLLREFGGERVVALEHDAHFASETRELIAHHDLSDLVEVRLASLKDVVIAGVEYRWYDPNVLDDIADVDLLLVDGPPKAAGQSARYPALPLLADRLSDRSTIILDDTNREEEKAIGRKWLREYPQMETAFSTAPNQTVFTWHEPNTTTG